MNQFSAIASVGVRLRFVKVATVLAVVLLSACASTQSISYAINAYEARLGEVALGQGKAEVLNLLEPTQASLAPRYKKPHEQYVEDDKLVEIYFYRSRSFSDGLVTDDEFTPYVFEDGVLVAIGWTAIGGPKTQAQPRDNDTHFFHHGRVFYY